MLGMHVHTSLIDAKEKESGATVHFVTAGIDEGEIILQGKVAVSEGDTPEKLAEKVHGVVKNYEIIIFYFAVYIDEFFCTIGRFSVFYSKK